MKRVLTWYIDHLIVGTQIHETYELEGDSTPVRFWCHVDRAPLGANINLDINYQELPDSTPVTIFTGQFSPGIQVGSTVGERDYFTNSIKSYRKHGLISLDIDQVGSTEGGKRLTVQLELELEDE